MCTKVIMLMHIFFLWGWFLLKIWKHDTQMLLFAQGHLYMVIIGRNIMMNIIIKWLKKGKCSVYI